MTIEDASDVWGTGIFNTTAVLSEIMGEGSHIACIGQAGENMVNMSNIMTGRSHSAGGHGGVMGSKKLKAIGVKGTKPIHIAGDSKKWVELDKYMMTIIGANNQHVVPREPQPWAEFHSESSRWTATPGRMWGAANPPVDTGTCEPSDMNSVGLRTQKALLDLGADSEKYLLRMGGCQSCPIRCHSVVKIPKLKDYGFNEVHGNTCMGYFSPGGVMFKGIADPAVGRTLGACLADDYGVWCNYGQIGRDLKYAYENGILEKVLPKEEYDSIPWQMIEDKNPEFLIEFYRRIANKEGEFGTAMGEGSAAVAKRWNFGQDYYHSYSYNIYNPVMVYPKHHSNESGAQVGGLISCMFNRDAQSHSVENFLASGLPTALQKEIAAEIFGSPDALDGRSDYTPMNQYKAKFAKWGIIRNVLHDSLTLCNWMWPMTVSPLKERNYRGDTSLESQFFSMATGIETSEAELDLAGERIFTLHRAMTVKQMGTKDMRNQHDVVADWVFDYPADQTAFTKGSIKMVREDFQLALTMFYKEMGWDETTGSPTKETLVRLGLTDVAKELEALHLL